MMEASVRLAVRPRDQVFVLLPHKQVPEADRLILKKRQEKLFFLTVRYYFPIYNKPSITLSHVETHSVGFDQSGAATVNGCGWKMGGVSPGLSSKSNVNSAGVTHFKL